MVKEKHFMSVNPVTVASQNQAATAAAQSKPTAKSQPGHPQDTITISAAAKSQQAPPATAAKAAAPAGDADHDGH
jgi:hypothetical protein